MHKALASICKHVTSYCRSENGSATIEHVLWLPVMTGFMMLTTDATILMNHQGHLYEVARDGARMVSVGQRTPQEAAEALRSKLANGENYDIDLHVDGDYVVSEVSIPFSKVALFSRSISGDATLSGGVVMWIEGDDDPAIEAGA